MKLKQKIGAVTIIVIASFLGGAAAQFLLAPSIARAAASQILRAEMMYAIGYDGKQRVQIGSYSGAYSKSEKGLPLIGFTDNHENLRLLFRLAGQNESPVLVFKDKHHRDRLVIGLGMSGSDESAFIAAIDESGKKKMVLGTY